MKKVLVIILALCTFSVSTAQSTKQQDSQKKTIKVKELPNLSDTNFVSILQQKLDSMRDNESMVLIPLKKGRLLYYVTDKSKDIKIKVQETLLETYTLDLVDNGFTVEYCTDKDGNIRVTKYKSDDPLSREEIPHLNQKKNTKRSSTGGGNG